MAAQGWTPVPEVSAWNPVAEPKQGAVSSYGEVTGLSQLIAHPIDSILGIPAAMVAEGKRSYGEAKQALAATDPIEVQRHITAAVPFIGQGATKAGGQVDEGNYAGAAGSFAGALTNIFAPEAIKGIKPAAIAEKAAPLIRTTGDAAVAAGNKLLNETVGSHMKDFNRGANPGRGYNEAIGGPSISMRSLAYKADAVKNQTGQAIGQAIEKSGKSGALIPVQDIYKAISEPLKEQFELENGPGGMGNTEAYAKYAENLKPILQKAVDNGGLTAQEVFDLKRSIAKRAKWSNTTPEGIMDVRQGQVGALGGLLTEAIPELADLNRNYQDLTGLADRAAWRAESGSKPFGGLVREGAKATGAVGAGLMHDPAALAAAGAIYAADTVPGRTAIATGLYRTGKGLGALADRLENTPENPVAKQAAPQMVRPVMNEPMQDYIRRKKAAQAQK